MPFLSVARAANAAFKPPYRPIAVFVGGTSGIGQGMAEVLAKHTDGNIHIVIVGRNKAKAEAIIESLPKPSGSASTYEFAQCDASLMKNVQACAESLVQRFPKINFLVLSQGILTMQGRTETEEGLDFKLALHFYSRWKFVGELLPSLKRAKEDGEHARVMTVLAAGLSARIDLKNIDLKTGYSLSAAASHAQTGNDIMVHEYATRNPDLTFIHILPGFVDTPLLYNDKPILGKLVAPLAMCFATKPKDCAEWMLYPLLASDYETGAYELGRHADDARKNKHVNEESRKAVWDHVEEYTKVK